MRCFIGRVGSELVAFVHMGKREIESFLAIVHYPQRLIFHSFPLFNCFMEILCCYQLYHACYSLSHWMPFALLILIRCVEMLRFGFHMHCRTGADRGQNTHAQTRRINLDHYATQFEASHLLCFFLI